MNIIYNETKPETIKVIFLDKEMEAAHEDYINRKRDNLFRIKTMIENSELPAIYRNWLEDVYNFIEEEK